MDLNRLVEFNTIAKLGSFTRAAEHLGISTAVLSARFSKFEEQIGQKLFERNSRAVELTDAGQRFIADSREIISDYFAAVRLGQSTAADYHLNLKLALTGFSIPSRISNVITQLNTKYLNLSVSLTDDPVWSDLLEGRVHLYIGCGGEPTNSRIECRSFGRFKQYVIVPRHHRLASRGEIFIKDLANERLLLYPETRLPGVRAQQLKLLSEADINCTVVNEFIAKSYYFDYVAAGMGIALLPYYGHPRSLPYGLVSVLLESPSTKLNSNMYYLNDINNPLLDSILRKQDRQRTSLEDYGWGDSYDY